MRTVSSLSWAEGMKLTAGTYFSQAIDYNHRSIALYSEYSDYGVYLEYTRNTCEICVYVDRKSVV